jgi:hypothetical protein
MSLRKDLAAEAGATHESGEAGDSSCEHCESVLHIYSSLSWTVQLVGCCPSLVHGLNPLEKAKYGRFTLGPRTLDGCSNLWYSGMVEGTRPVVPICRSLGKFRYRSASVYPKIQPQCGAGSGVRPGSASLRATESAQFGA